MDFNYFLVLSTMKFKKIFLSITLLICSLAITSPVTADFNDGWDAYTNGDFRTLIMPLENGDHSQKKGMQNHKRI